MNVFCKRIKVHFGPLIHFIPYLYCNQGMWIGDEEDGSGDDSHKPVGDISGSRDANSKGSSKQEIKKNKQKQKKENNKSNAKVPSVIDLSDSLIITKQSAQQQQSSSTSKEMFHDDRLNKKQKTTTQNNATQKQQGNGVDRIGYSTDATKMQVLEMPGRKSVDQLSSSLRGLKFMKRKEDEQEAKDMVAEQKREASDFFWTIPQTALENVVGNSTNDIEMADNDNTNDEEDDENKIGFTIADDSDELAAIGNFGRRAFGNDNAGISGFGSAKDSSHSKSKDKNGKYIDDGYDEDDEDNEQNEDESDREDTVFKLANMTRGHAFEKAAKALNKKRDKEKEKVQKDAARLVSFSYTSSSRKRR